MNILIPHKIYIYFSFNFTRKWTHGFLPSWKTKKSFLIQSVKKVIVSKSCVATYNMQTIPYSYKMNTEHVTHCVQDIGELLKSMSEVEVIGGRKRKDSYIKEIFRNQIIFCKHNLVKNLHLKNILRWWNQLAININSLIYSN